MNISEIYKTLYRLGITENYTGFHYTAYAVYISVQNPQYLLLVTKWLYPDVAKHYRTTWKCVERDIRTVVNVAWKTNPELLGEMAQRFLSRKPKPSQFLAILSSYFYPKTAA